MFTCLYSSKCTSDRLLYLAMFLVTIPYSRWQSSCASAHSSPRWDNLHLYLLIYKCSSALYLSTTFPKFPQVIRNNKSSLRLLHDRKGPPPPNPKWHRGGNQSPVIPGCIAEKICSRLFPNIKPLITVRPSWYFNLQQPTCRLFITEVSCTFISYKKFCLEHNATIQLWLPKNTLPRDQATYQYNFKFMLAMTSFSISMMAVRKLKKAQHRQPRKKFSMQNLWQNYVRNNSNRPKVGIYITACCCSFANTWSSDNITMGTLSFSC